MIPTVAAVLPGNEAIAQSFGKNKVQYDKFAWYYIQTRHFDIYFYQKGDSIARFTAIAAEDALKSIQKDIGYELTNRIPIILYNSHNDFQQTNAVDIYMEEGIGGVTELFKNRIILPFEGSWRNFRHVIHHELVHGVLNDMFYGGSVQSIISNNIRIQLPLWFNEGLAEYESLHGWNTDSDMFLRDASTSNTLPPVKWLNGYYAYRGGQSIWWYIAEKYGKRKVGEVLNRVRSAHSVDMGFKAAIGLNVEELSEKWLKEQKVIYWPDVAKRVSPEDYAKRLTNHTKLGNFYNTSPAISPAGDRIAFISDRDDYFGVYIMSTSDEAKVTRLIEGQNTKDFEELHLLTPGISWSPDGRKLALSTKAGANDAIYVVDVESGKTETLPVSWDGIFSVAWSPDGSKLAFVGNSSSSSDIWMYDFASRQTTNLTNDVFSDNQPGWSNDSRKIFFTSDRRDYVSGTVPRNFDIARHDFDCSDIYSIDIESGKIERLTDTPGANESSPIASPDGKKMLFISDRNGINNIYIMDLDTKETHPITNSLTGIYQMSLTRDGHKLAFSSMFEAGFDVFMMKSPLTTGSIDSLEPTEFLQRVRHEALIAARRDTIETIDSSSLRTKDVVSYGGDIAVQLGNQQVAADTAVASPGRMQFNPGTSALPKRRNGMADSLGSDTTYAFTVNKYKLSFTPDLVYGNAGYSTFYGVLGTTQIGFSDMLGNHQIVFLTNLVGDLKNSDFALAYYYLPDRIDWGIYGYHSARFIYGTDGYYDYLYRYRQYGGSLSMQYPFSKFNRIEGAISIMNISRENLDLPSEPTADKTVEMIDIGFVHDNSLWGSWAPVKGTRYELRTISSPGFKKSDITFISLLGDYRTYFKFWDDASFVIRLAGGASFGKNPQRFFIGGTENWINRTFESGHIPIDNIEDFAFLTAALPLRGYNYNVRIASKYALSNLELRFPLVKYFLGGILPYILQTLNAAMFVDVGTAVNGFSGFKAYGRNEQGALTYQDLLIGTGFGIRMWFLGFPLKFDVAWPYRGAGFGEPKYYISLGAEF
jgi:Tol biopolymer transport system component